MRRQPRTRDFREFVFTATGKDTALDKLEALDVYDNLVVELDRLEAVAELLSCARPDDLDAHALEGTALLLQDVHHRMRAILELSRPRTPVKPLPGPRR